MLIIFVREDRTGYRGQGYTQLTSYTKMGNMFNTIRAEYQHVNVVIVRMLAC